MGEENGVPEGLKAIADALTAAVGGQPWLLVLGTGEFVLAARGLRDLCVLLSVSGGVIEKQLAQVAKAAGSVEGEEPKIVVPRGRLDLGGER